MRAAIRAGAAAALLLLSPLPTHAQSGFSSPQAESPRFTADQIAAFSKQIERDLGSRGVRVAMVFRLGRPHGSTPPGINYTHGAFWVYRGIQTQNGAVQHGYAVYNLFSGDGKAWPTTTSRLVQDWPFEFTRGSAVDDVGVIIPSPEMQRRILAVLDSPTYEALHNPSYSLIANPLRDKHQNCNSFMLDVVASAAWETADPGQIRADLRAHYRPSPVQASPLKRLFAPLADNRLKTDDQSSPIVTATYESIAAFMRENGLLQAAYSLNRTPDTAPRPEQAGSTARPPRSRPDHIRERDMPSAADTSDQPYTSENENTRSDGEGSPPQPASTPQGSEGSAAGSKTRTDPQTGAPTGAKPEKG